MGKKSPKQPAAPDPKATAESQLQTNIGTALTQARLNMVDQVTPFGSVRYEQIAPSPVAGGGASGGGAASAAPQYATPALDPKYAGQKVMTNTGTTINLDDLFGGVKNPIQIPQSGGNNQGGFAFNSADSIPRYRQVVDLNPAEQLALDQTRSIRERTNDIVGSNVLPALRKFTGEQFSYSGLPELKTDFAFNNLPAVNRQNVQMDVGANDFSADRRRVEDATFNRQRRYLDPLYEQQEKALETKLANQGIMVGNDAYSRANADFSRNKDTAYQDAIDRAVLAGGGEQSRLFGMDVTKGQFRNSAQDQDFQQQFNLRGQASNEQLAEAQLAASLASSARSQLSGEQLSARQQQGSELTSLMGLPQGANIPQAGAAPQVGVQAPDLQGAVYQNYQGQLNNYNQKVGANNAAMGGIAGLAGALGGAYLGNPAFFAASDRRLKENIVAVDEVGGLTVYEFNYTGSPARFRGLMADEVKEVIPDAVHTGDDGYMRVDYSKTPIMMEAL